MLFQNIIDNSSFASCTLKTDVLSKHFNWTQISQSLSGLTPNWISLTSNYSTWASTPFRHCRSSRLHLWPAHHCRQSAVNAPALCFSPLSPASVLVYIRLVIMTTHFNIQSVKCSFFQCCVCQLSNEHTSTIQCILNIAGIKLTCAMWLYSSTGICSIWIWTKVRLTSAIWLYFLINN